MEKLKKRYGFLPQISGLTLATVAGQAVGMANLTVVVRLFTQEDIGLYSTFLSYCGIIVAVNLLSWHLALPIAESADFVPVLYGLALLNLFWLAAVVGVFTLFKYPYPLPLALQAFSQGVINVAQQTNVRNQDFVKIALSRLLPGVVFSMCVAGFYYSQVYSVDALIWSQMASLASVALVYGGVTFWRVEWTRCTPRAVLQALGRYRKFAFFSLPSAVSTGLAFNLPVILIEGSFGAAMAAQFSVVQRYCYAPINLITMSVQQVYHSKLAHIVRHDGTDGHAFFFRIRNVLLPVGGAVGLGIALFFPSAIDAVLGGGWEVAGGLARIMSPVFALMVLVAPLSVAFYVLEKQEVDTYFQLAALAVVLATFGYGIYMDDLTLAVVTFSLLSSLRYGLQYFWVRRLTLNGLRTA